MSGRSAFLFVDAGTGTTQILAWHHDTRRSFIPCGNIGWPPRDCVTYEPTKPLCRTCDKMTRQVFDRDVPRTRNG